MNYSTDEVIKALYRAVLNREPDEEGLRTHKYELEQNHISLGDLADVFHDSKEHRSIMGQPNGIPDRSQHGELLKILRLVMQNGSKYSLIVDVGARGRDRSNSFDLLTSFGWRGLLVEANPALYDQIRHEFDGLDFTLVECAVGPEEGRLPFFIGANDDVSSLNRDAAIGWGDLRGRVDVDVRRLHHILDQHAVPFDFDVLSIDIESVDVPVLNDLIASSAYRPRIIVIEVVHQGLDTSLSAIGASDIVQSCYDIVDYTQSNLFLKRRF